MRLRAWTAVVAALAASAGFVAELRAGDPPKKPPAAAAPGKPVASPTIPERFVKPTRRIADLVFGESSRFRSRGLRITPEGVGWLSPTGLLAESDKVGDFTLPKATRVAADAFDVDLTECDGLWSLVTTDGTPYVPKQGDVKVRRFLHGDDKPSDVLPDHFRGEFLWSLAPGRVAYISTLRVGVDLRGEAYVYAKQPVRAEPFVDGGGPAVQVTASDRDVVKMNLDGVKRLWTPDFYPDNENLNEDGSALNGHKLAYFGVSSFTFEGRQTIRMPQEFMAPPAKDAKPGVRWFVEPNFVRLDTLSGAWIFPETPLHGLQREDDWGYKFVAATRQADGTFVLDLAGSGHRWCVVGLYGDRVVPEPDGTVMGHSGKLIKVSAYVDGAKPLGATMPASSVGDRIWNVAEGSLCHASARFLGVLKDRTGYVAGWIPVAREPFTDECGPSIALTIGVGETCAVDLSNATWKWEIESAPDFKPLEKPSPGGQRVHAMKVTQFVAPAPPPEPPAKKPSGSGKKK